jgi:hypothetical protein
MRGRMAEGGAGEDDDASGTETALAAQRRNIIPSSVPTIDRQQFLGACYRTNLEAENHECFCSSRFSPKQQVIFYGTKY